MNKEIVVFGCTKAELNQAIETSLVFQVYGKTVHAATELAMSMMSDAQELLNRGRTKEANQQINCAKYTLAVYAK